MDSSEFDSFLINKYINELKSDDKKQRRKALENIKQELNKIDDKKKLATYFEMIQKQLIRCLKDNSEAVRELAVLILIDLLKVVSPREDYISSLMPIISDRLSGDLGIVTESSEEVRLCLISLLLVIISHYEEYLLHYLDDFINILVKTIIDPNPKVKKESCDCVAVLAEKIPRHFHMRSESVIPSLIQTISYQQYRVRVAGINAIGTVVQHGNNKSVNDVCGPFAERLFDQHHAVRAAVANAVGTWLLELPDRYSYFHKLIPLMLTSLTEEIPELRKKAEELWAKVGNQFLLENESDLKEKMDYLKENLDHYPHNVNRPNLGCRTLVERELSKYLPAIVVELDDWKPDIRVKSAQLLCVTVQHAESSITQHLEKTLPALYKACGDPDSRVVDNIELAAEMIGFFVPPDVYWHLIQPSIQDSTSPGPLRVLAAMLRTSKHDSLLLQINSITDTLTSEVICFSRQMLYQKQLLNVVESIQKIKDDVVPVTSQLFTILVSILGLSADVVISTQAQGQLQQLAQQNRMSLQELYQLHTPALLKRITSSLKEWSNVSPQRSVFEALLMNSGSAVGENIFEIISVFEHCLSPENNPEATLQMLMAMSFILVHSKDTLSSVEDLPQVIHLCIKVLQPQLVWRAGRSAEALRTAAVGCVVTALDLLISTQELAEILVPVLLALAEDSAFKTRQFALVALLKIIKSLRETNSLNAQNINSTFLVVLKRLDDNNDKVRETAVKILSQLFRSPLPQDFSPDCFKNNLETVYDTMLLHLDDSSPTFQDTMLGALKEISTAQPHLLKSRIQKDNFRSKGKCEELIAHLNNLHM